MSRTKDALFDAIEHQKMERGGFDWRDNIASAQIAVDQKTADLKAPAPTKPTNQESEF